MAKLESIRFTPMREAIEDGIARWEFDKLGRRIDKLPQIFWDSGEPWSEANHWALTKALSTVGGDIQTVTSLMKHLTPYACWLESTGMDWRHFPMRMTDRAIVQFRGELIRQRDELGLLAPSTTTSRMAAVIQFYRHAQIYGFVGQSSPMWRDRQVLHRFVDPVGFERTMLRISSELAIPNRRRIGEQLEDGLTPLRPEHSAMLLDFTQKAGLQELHLMLSIGLLTGARIETISTLRVKNIEGALPDDSMHGFYRVRVGPGTGVNTKFDVSGDLLVPDFLMDALKRYAYSMRRLRRQALASDKNRGRLFLTVNAPTLDLANRELVQSHLHAIWLAETGKKLGNSIRDLLDMERPDELPLTTDLADDLDRPSAQRRAHERGLAVLAMLRDELTPERAPWYTSSWPETVFQRAFKEFDAALNRWRDLYRATVRQIELNYRIENNPAANERERREAQQRHNEARKQRDLLLAGDSAFNSDFYTYRYLASQGFLPGYNFPRLPLLAYIPARRGNIGRESFLSRPRFLALGEFGPYSLIYHEGSQYRVTKALLTIGGQDQVAEGAKLPTEVARLCPVCGYGHFRTQRDADRCVSCGASLDGAEQVKNLYRIENVATKRVERITANEEERVRQGYEMQTTLQFAEAEGKLQKVTTVVMDEEGPLLELQYGPAATIWRMNYGWRRRKEKSVLGFLINPVTGHWMGGENESGEGDEEDAPPDRTPPQRIVPFVEDRRNILVVKPHPRLGLLSLVTMTTLQYALKRGVESVYQLEESELMAEPLPGRNNRQSILFFEAAEGGAGVLTRIATEPTALAEVAKEALEIMHFKRPSEGQTWNKADLAQELDEIRPT